MKNWLKIGRVGKILLLPYVPHRHTSKTLVHAMITSRIDYCNSLLCGLPDNSLNKLQRVQNAAARLITGTAKFSHITPVLRTLHWLPIKQRVQFKMLILVFKPINGLAPNYITNLVNILCPSIANICFVETMRYYWNHTMVKPRKH